MNPSVLIELFVDPRGGMRCLYTEAIDLSAVGALTVTRVSLVEPDADGRWLADLTPVDGPVLGPYPRRSEALVAEATWLTRHVLARPA